RVWRPRAIDAWRRSGFAPGQTILDIGAGPGFATIGLAVVFGPRARVIAVDRSRRFLSVLEAACCPRDIHHVADGEADLDHAAAKLRTAAADGSWSRWVFSFVQRPRRVREGVAGALKAGGTLVLHEYFDCSTWRLAPPSAEIEAFVGEVMASW